MTAPLSRKIVGTTAIFLILVQVIGAAALADDPNMDYSPLDIVFLNTTVNVTVTNGTGAIACFDGYIQNNVPRVKVSAEVMVSSSTWPAYAVPMFIAIQGRDNVSFIVNMEVPPGVENGTSGNAKVMIVVLVTYPGGNSAGATQSNLLANVTNINDVPAGSSTIDQLDDNATMSMKDLPKADGSPDGLMVFTASTLIVAVASLISRIALKYKAMNRRLVKSP